MKDVLKFDFLPYEIEGDPKTSHHDDGYSKPRRDLRPLLERYIDTWSKTTLESWLGKGWKFIKWSNEYAPKEIVTMDVNQDIALNDSYIHGFFTMEGPTKYLGNRRIGFDITIKTGRKPIMDWTCDTMMNQTSDDDIAVALKDVYLSIKDSDNDENYVMKRRKQRVFFPGTYVPYYHVPRTFRDAIDDDPYLVMYFDYEAEGIADAYQVKQIFDKCNELYYDEWAAIHRTGLKGTIKTIKTWFVS